MKVEATKFRKTACRNIKNDIRNYFDQSGNEIEEVVAGLEKNKLTEKISALAPEGMENVGAEADGSENILEVAASTIKDAGIKNWGEQKKHWDWGKF